MAYSDDLRRYRFIHCVGDLLQACFTRTFWMSMPSETRHVPRIQAVWDLVRQTVQAQRAVLVPPEFDLPGR